LFCFVYILLATNFKPGAFAATWQNGQKTKNILFLFCLHFNGDKIQTLAWQTTATRHHQELRPGDEAKTCS
jgi:hypothetical protein